MTQVVRICLVGATGLVGRAVMTAAVGRQDLRLVALARRAVALPPGASMEMLVADAARWPDLIASTRADVLVSALGTTIRAAGSREAFCAVDHDLVLRCAQAARGAGIARMIAVSSVGADSAARAFYLRTKGEVEENLGKIGFARLDLLRPGLLLGRRDRLRPLEALGQVAAPLLDMAVLQGKWRRYRSIRASTVASAILAFAGNDEPGRFVHDYDSIRTAARGRPARAPAGRGLR